MEGGYFNHFIMRTGGERSETSSSHPEGEDADHGLGVLDDVTLYHLEDLAFVDGLHGTVPPQTRLPGSIVMTVPPVIRMSTNAVQA